MFFFWIFILWPAWAFAETAGESLAPVVVTEDRVPGRPASSGEFKGARVEFDARGETSIARILSRRAGVFVQRAGGDDSHAGFQLRGQDPVQSRFFLESIPLTDALYQSSTLSWFPIEAMESISVFPEGTPAALGSDGLGGAIALSLLPPGSKSLVGSRFGSFGAARFFARGSDRSSLPVSLFLDATSVKEDFTFRDNAGTPLNPDDDRWLTRGHNGQKALTLLPQVRLWSSSQGHVDLFSFHTFRQTEVPGPVDLPLQGGLTQQFHLAAMQGVSSLGAGRSLNVSAYAWQQDSTFNASSEMAALQVRNSNSTTAGARLLLQQEGERISGDLGAGAHWESASLDTWRGQNLAAQRVHLPFSLSSLWAFSEYWSLKPTILTQGFFYQGDSPRQTWHLSPRLALEWSIRKGQRVRAVGGIYQRAPGLSELYGSPSVISANPRLLDEQAIKGEVGWDARWPVRSSGWRDVELSTTFSFSQAQNLIVLIPNSQSSFIAQNIGSSRILCPEVALEAGWLTHWFLRLNFSVLGTQNLTPIPAYQGKALPMRPAYHGAAEIEWAPGSWRLTYSLSATGALFADPANARVVGAYWEHGLWSSWNSRGWGTWLLELRNLTDAVTVAGQDWNFSLNQNTTGLSGFPSPGRRVYFTWRYDI